MQKITTDHSWNYLHYWNDPGTYLLENSAAAACMAQSPDCVVETIEDPKSIKGFSPINCKDGDSIVIVRPGAYGDLLMLTPLVRALRQQFPLSTVTVACAEAYGAALRGVVATLPYPMRESELLEFDHVIWMEDTLEAEVAKDTLGVEVFAQKAGISLSDGSHLDYVVSEIEAAEVNQQLPAKDSAKKPRIAIQCRASTPLRTYSTEKWVEVIRGLWRKNCEIFLLGAPNEITGFDSEENSVVDIHNMTTIPLSFRQSASVLATADLFIGVDSSLTHVAGALGVPSISLHGPVAADVRTRNLPKNLAIEGDKSRCDIAPCYYHQKGGQVFPVGQACEKSGHCEVLESISADDVISEAVEVLQMQQPDREDK